MTDIDSKNGRRIRLAGLIPLLLFTFLLTGCGMGLDESWLQHPLFRGLMILGDTALVWVFWAMTFFWVLFTGRLLKGYGPNWSVFFLAMTTSLGFWAALIAAALVLRPGGYWGNLFTFRYPLYSILVLASHILPFYLALALMFYFSSWPSLRFVRRCGRKGELDRLRAFVNSTEYKVQQEAALAFGLIPRENTEILEGAFRQLVSLLRFRPDLKKQALEALRSLGSVVVPQLRSELENSSDPPDSQLAEILHTLDSLAAYGYLVSLADGKAEQALRGGSLAGRLFPDRREEWAALYGDRKTTRSLFGRMALLSSGDPAARELVLAREAARPRLTVTVDTLREESRDGYGLVTVCERPVRRYAYDGLPLGPVAGRMLAVDSPPSAVPDPIAVRRQPSSVKGDRKKARG